MVWDDKGASEHKITALSSFYGPSFIIALRRQINDNPYFRDVLPGKQRP